MLKSRTWFTENTEVLTSVGWVSVKNLGDIKDVLVLDETVKIGTILEYNKAFYRGNVFEWRHKDFYCKAKNLILPNSKIWRVGKELDIPKNREVPYKGMIYNIITSNNNLITRCLKDGKDNEDYILSVCQIVD